MVRLIQGVARCAPIGVQRATNGGCGATADATPAQPQSVSHRETEALNAQPAPQPAHNTDATSGVNLHPQKLRVVAGREGELRGLIHRVLTDPSERAEALAVGLADLDVALESYRDLASDLPKLPAELDARRRCDECRNLSDRGQCFAAFRGQALGFNVLRVYHPVATLPQWCAGFAPLPGDPDQRMGWERWPTLLAAHRPLIRSN